MPTSSQSHFWRPFPRYALRPEEAAASFGVSLNTFKMWEQQGFMPHPYHIGGVVLYDGRELAEAWERKKETYSKSISSEKEPWDNDGE